MTILCLVRNPRDNSWAAFSDCLITTDEKDSGPSLVTPIRVNLRERETVGFAESALEEKLGFLEPGLVLGWAGSRHDAIIAANAIKGRKADSEIVAICQKSRNCYFVARYGNGESSVISFFGPSIERIDSNGFEFYYAGAGARILSGMAFTAKHRPLAENAVDVVSALLTALSRFLSEEMAGQTSQYYSLRTGGHYQVLYGAGDTVRRLHYCVNHWHQGESEPLVHRISIPLQSQSHQVFASLNVGNGWDLSISSIIALAPLLQSPRSSNEIQIKREEIFDSTIAGFSFHVCWLSNSHQTFVVNLREPQFDVSGQEVHLRAYNERTLEMVGELLNE